MNTRETQIEQARRLIATGISEDLKEVLEKQYPELRESEDERIRQGLLFFIKKEREKKHLTWNKIPLDDYEAYLEKQKEQNGEDKECTDFTIYHPLKNGKGKYECIPYSFYGSLTSFSEDKKLIDFLRTCFYTKEECNEWIEQQKEQKPSTPEDIAAAYQMGLAKGRKEQKPAEWSEEDRLVIDRACVALRSYANGDLPNFLPSMLLEYANRLQSLRPCGCSEKPNDLREQSVVDLERDAVQFCFDKGLNVTPYQAKTIAHYFYEIGLTVRKEE